MNNFSDKNVIIIILGTIFVVFAFIFSVKSPERKVIESPIIWKEKFSTISFFENDLVDYQKSHFIQPKIGFTKLVELKSIKVSFT